MKAIHAAKSFLALAGENGDTITNLKMQKLLYYAQAWHLVRYGKPLFSDKIEAWAFGPVIKNVYAAFKKSCHSPIPLALPEKSKPVPTAAQKKFILKIYENFMPFTARQLTAMTHLEDPWLKTYEKHKINVISNAGMKDFYGKLLKKSERGKRK